MARTAWKDLSFAATLQKHGARQLAVARRIAGCTLLWMAVCLRPEVGCAADPPARVMIGYYASFGDLKVDDIPWQRLTHLCHAFLTTDSDGKLVTNNRVPSRALTTAAHAKGVRVLLSLGGGNTTAAFEQVTKSDSAIVRYTEQVVGLVAANEYDGIDVDWEYPRTSAMKDKFTRLIVALRQKLDAAPNSRGRYELTAAVSTSNYFGQHIDTAAVVPQLDWLHVMTYDFSGPWDRIAAHHAPLLPSRDDPARSWRSVESAMAYWHQSRHVPADKLVVGLPLYGRAFPATKRYARLDPQQKKQHGVLTYREIQQLLKNKWKASWDDELQVPWMQTPTGEKLLVAYDDRNSIFRKTLWTREQGYRGVFFWALHQDRMPDGKHWLVEAAHKAWPK